jgi:hypothetical protein
MQTQIQVSDDKNRNFTVKNEFVSPGFAVYGFLGPLERLAQATSL